MKKSRTTGRIITVLVMTMVFALLAAPAWATDTIPNHATLIGSKGSVDLFGMTEVEARAAITSVAPEPVLGKLTLKGYATSYSPPSIAGAVWVDKTAIIAKASAAPSPTTFTMTPIYAVNSASIARWVARLNGLAVGKQVSGVRTVRFGKLVIVPLKVWTVRTTATRALLTAQFKLQAAKTPADAAKPWTVSALLVKNNSKTPAASFAKVKTIVVVLSKRTVTLYTGARVTVWYRCAVGQSAYPTPKGVWNIYMKNPRPSWYNPGSAWAAGMPSVIGPGASNPLGLRALYLDAPGIRIHGTSNVDSIGTAASHGCIRLANSNIVKLYPLVPVGTKVYIVK